MRKSYPGYQASEDRNFAKLWSDCSFSLDASALLDFYRVTPATRDKFFEVLERLNARIWLPHQAGLEYYDNRQEVISTGEASYNRVTKMAQDLLSQFKKGLDTFRQYRWIEGDLWLGMLEKSIGEICNKVDSADHVLHDYANADPIRERLEQLFSGKIGSPYKDIHDYYIRAEKRLELQVPPGFEDAGRKKDFHRYGDVILWFQLLDHAKSQKKGIVFVTSDAKADWWTKANGRTEGPRPELIQEMHTIAGVPFHMYSPHRFIEYAQEYLCSHVHIKRNESELPSRTSGHPIYSEETMADTTLTIPDIMLIAGTRVALGIGIGLLISGRLSRDARKGAGLALFLVGALTSIPLFANVARGRPTLVERQAA